MVSERDRENIGHKGGEAAANRSTSAAAIAKTLSGIDFPKNKNDVVSYAQQHKGNTQDSDAVVNVLNQIPDRQYNSMADLEKAIGQVE